MTPISPTRPAASRYAVLALLSLIYLLHSVDRQVIGVVMEPLKHEFGVSDKMLGLLGGLAYAFAFAIACLPIGWLIDRFNRVRLLAALLTAWSGLTVLCGFASGYWVLLLARIGVGAAEAGAAPDIISVIADLFSARQRSFAIGLCYTCAALGVSLSFLVGSAVAAAHGWRSAFWLAGGPGLVLAALLAIFVREPRRGSTEADDGAETEDVPSLAQATTYVFRTPGLVHLTSAISLSAFVLTTLWVWTTSFMIRYHGLSLAQAGRLIAFAALFQAAGSWLGGVTAERAAGRSVSAFGIVSAGSALAALPLGVGLTLADNVTASIACLCGMAFFSGAWTGPAFGLAMGLSKPRVRGVVGSFIQLFVNLVGAGVGPFVAGLLSDTLGGGLRSALTICFTVNLWAAFHYVAAARHAKIAFETNADLTPSDRSLATAH